MVHFQKGGNDFMGVGLKPFIHPMSLFDLYQTLSVQGHENKACQLLFFALC